MYQKNKKSSSLWPVFFEEKKAKISKKLMYIFTSIWVLHYSNLVKIYRYVFLQFFQYNFVSENMFCHHLRVLHFFVDPPLGARQKYVILATFFIFSASKSCEKHEKSRFWPVFWVCRTQKVIFVTSLSSRVWWFKL